jgi:protein arginine N-methyltransferase 3
MGYFLLFESMLDTVLWARDRYLVSGGIILPDKCNISLAAIDDHEMHETNYGYWSDVYGFKMTCMRTAVQKEASVLSVSESTVISDPIIIKVRFTWRN